jgi:uncharacterized protein DUF6611
MVSRHGVRRYRLVIYPPGISTAQRLLARLWRGWPISGAALMLLVVMLFGDVAATAGHEASWWQAYGRLGAIAHV